MKKVKKQPGTWKRCICGRLVKVPLDPRGHGCPKCAAPLTWAKPIQ
jgi:hypothetical protein